MSPTAWVRLCLAVVLLSSSFLQPSGAQGQALLAPAAEKGKKHALLVGVRKYDSIKFDTLKYTENDVEELGAILSGRGGFTAVRLLTTTRGEKNKADAPTADNVRAAVKALLAKKTRHNLLLVALAGHGIQAKVKDSDESFFCPADAQLNDTDTLISLTKLVKDLDGCGAGIKLLLADACRNEPGAGRNVDVDTLPRLPRGTAALFSCKSGERAFETAKLGKGHGVFFFHVLQGLRGKARDARGAVTWARLAEHVTDAVSDEVPVLIGGGARQTPELKVNLTGKSPVLIPPSGISPEAERLFKLAEEYTIGGRRMINYPESVRLYRLAADRGHPFAAGFVGARYAWGTGVPSVDRRRAEQVCGEVAEQVREAARTGDAAAQWLLGCMHGSGLGVVRDDEKALHWLRKAAAQGHPWAPDQIGMRYLTGEGVEKDYAEAMRWFRKSADRGFPGGQLMIGRMHENGQGVPKDYAEALRWYRKAAEQYEAKAQNNIGWMYRMGLGVEKDYAAALRWYRKAAQQNYASAQNNIGWMYQNGFGVAKDSAEALRWFRKAAEQNHAGAQNLIGWMYKSGHGVAKDYEEALRWYHKAAEQDDASAQNNIGVMYHDGLGVAKDYAEALRWFRKAAEQGGNWGQNNLGDMYFYGRAVVKDEAAATRWYRKAADQGLAEGQFNLGWCYENGRGVARDLDEARKWYRKAAAQDHANARKRLSGLE
jgi:TPR repeat protein